MQTDTKWGVFRQREEFQEVHVAPTYQDGLILEHHIVDVLCPCGPRVEGETPDGRLIVVHRED